MPLRNRGRIWHFRFKVDGKTYAATTDLAATKQNETRALAIELEYREALLEGRRPSRRIVIRQFSDAAEEFLAWAEVEHRAHPNTYKRLVTSFASLKEYFANQPVSLIDEALIEDYKTWRISEHEVRDVTLRHDLHALSKFFGYAVKQHWTRDNPARNVSIPSDSEAIRIHVITAAEEAEYFRRATKNLILSDAARLIRNQGMRPEEVTSLQKIDVDLDAGQVHIRNGKTPAARRTLDLTAESKSILARRMQDTSSWIFPSKRCPGRPIARLNNAHDRVCAAKPGRKALAFVLYDFRHTFATQLAQAGVDLATVAAILGHSSLRIVQRYVHPTAEHKKNAMAKFDQIFSAAEESNSSS